MGADPPWDGPGADRMNSCSLEAVASWPVNIGTAAMLSGISPKMLRHYESMGLLGEVARTDSNYRQYSLADVHSLRFIRRARDMGFGLEAITELVGLWHNRRRSSASVRRVAQKHLDELGPAHHPAAGDAAHPGRAGLPLPWRRPARLPDPRRPGPSLTGIKSPAHHPAGTGTNLYRTASQGQTAVHTRGRHWLHALRHTAPMSALSTTRSTS